MDYQKHYDRLILRAKDRVLEGYVERHHVVPKCIGGSNDRDNLVALTPEEHFVAHQLLHKLHPTVSGLAFALISMTGNPHGERSNKVYGWIRKKQAIAASVLFRGLHQDPEYKAKLAQGRQELADDLIRSAHKSAALSKANKGRVKSAQERANIAEAGRNRATRVFSEEARLNMAAARKKTWEERRATGQDLEIAAKTKATRVKNGSYTFTEKHKAKIAESGKGRVPYNKGTQTSEETRAKQSSAAQRRWEGIKMSPEEAKDRKAERAIKNAKHKMSKEELSAVRTAASKKMWEERRAKGEHLDIGQRAADTRRANGNNFVSEEAKAKIMESLKGNNNRVKNMK